MLLTDFFQRRFRTLAVVVICLTLVAAIALNSNDAYAGKKKKKKGKEEKVDPAVQQQNYMRELLKTWSFGHENYKNKQYSDAVRWLWKVVELDTMSKFGARTFRYLGDSYVNMQKPDSAKAIFEMGSDKYPDDVYLQRMVGYFLQNTEQIEEAIPRYLKVVELKPESIADWKQLASLYVKSDQIEDAVDAYDKIIELNPNDIAAKKDQAQLLQMIDPEAALEKKIDVAGDEPQNSQVRFELGKTYFDRGEYEESIKWFSEFLNLQPSDVGAIEYIGTSYLRLERYNDAIAEYKKILEIDPEHKKVMTDISRCYKDLNNFRAARTYAKKATALDPNYGLGWIALGEVYEACADQCVDGKDGKIEFDDKLVYELAYVQYRKAISDLQFRGDAEKRISFVKAVLPTTEDKFMNKGQKRAKGACYTWIY
ncbi:tetratricopeptide repeat protein [bacterium]|nr:tetratricopeptide repeat protein [bacterium]